MLTKRVNRARALQILHAYGLELETWRTGVCENDHHEGIVVDHTGGSNRVVAYSLELYDKSTGIEVEHLNILFDEDVLKGRVVSSI